MTLYIKSYSREDSEKDTEVMVKIIMAISLFANLFPVAPMPGKCRVGMKRDSGKGEKKKKNLLAFFWSFL